MFSMKVHQDFEPRMDVSMLIEALPWTCVIMLDLLMAVYLLFWRSTKGKHWQTNFLNAWVNQVIT